MFCFSSSVRYTKSKDAMLAATRSGVMPASWLRGECQPDQVEFLHDLVGQARVGRTDDLDEILAWREGRTVTRNDPAL